MVIYLLKDILNLFSFSSSSFSNKEAISILDTMEIIKANCYIMFY